MNFILKREHLANSYFLSILARVSKGLNPHQTSGVESLNNQIFKELGVNYTRFINAKKTMETHRLIDISSPDYSFIEGIENLVESGVAFYLNKHGHTLEAQSSEHALQIAVEALKDEFEGESGASLEVSDNGDTNSGVIQAILDDLKNRQADEVGRTVNLILKLNADKQRELLDEQQANSEEIDDTLNETGLGGEDPDNPEASLDGENPLEEGAQELDDQKDNPEGEASFEDDPFAEETKGDKSGDKSGSAEEDAPTLEDKKGSKKKESGNPFEGFESMVLAGRSPLDQAGTEALLEIGKGGVGAVAHDAIMNANIEKAGIYAIDHHLDDGFKFLKSFVGQLISESAKNV